MDEKKHASIRIIRTMTHIHSMFLYCLKCFPELNDKIKENLEKFMSDETNRHKESLPNLGCIFAYLSVNNKYTF